jgi:hypothetical protein
MDDLRTKQSQFDIIKWFQKNKPYFYKTFIIIGLYFILFKPIHSASVISNWINQFVGTLINNINI